ncbi:MAG: lytic transglycosylase domain-containing protein [Hyphomicrobiales bacterium]|nr:lytic transglycosylase domain-containing protein [Hyphomicrobiales bacterium]
MSAAAVLAAFVCASLVAFLGGSDPASASARSDARSELNGLIAKHARKNGVPLDLAHAVITIESRYNPRARGQAGEIGLMQIKPATARGMGYRGSASGLYDPYVNLTWGMRYLGEAKRRADGDLCGTILRYNAGHYARRMNRTSARYCAKVKAMMASNTVAPPQRRLRKAHLDHVIN